MAERRIVDLKLLYEETAKLDDDLSNYIKKARELVGEGNEVVL